MTKHPYGLARRLDLALRKRGPVGKAVITSSVLGVLIGASLLIGWGIVSVGIAVLRRPLVKPIEIVPTEAERRQALEMQALLSAKAAREKAEAAQRDQLERDARLEAIKASLDRTTRMRERQQALLAAGKRPDSPHPRCETIRGFDECYSACTLDDQRDQIVLKADFAAIEHGLREQARLADLTLP